MRSVVSLSLDTGVLARLQLLAAAGGNNVSRTAEALLVAKLDQIDAVKAPA